MHRRAFGLDGKRRAKVQRPMRQVHEVTAEVRQRAAAKRPPLAPVTVQVLRVITHKRRRAEPEIVVEILRHRGKSVARPLPPNCYRPHMHFAHGADHIASYQPTVR